MNSTNSNQSMLEQALARLIREVRDGLQHGFFELTIIGETVKGSKRALIIKAGKNHRYILSEDDLDT